jgi:hypothetical protein
VTQILPAYSANFSTFYDNYISTNGSQVNGNGVYPPSSAATFVMFDRGTPQLPARLQNDGGQTPLRSGNTVHLLAPNGYFVKARNGGSCSFDPNTFPYSDCPLEATASNLEPHAWFAINRVSSCWGCTLNYGDQVSLASYYGKYVAAEYGGAVGCSNCNPPVNANRDTVGEWETFRVFASSSLP